MESVFGRDVGTVKLVYHKRRRLKLIRKRNSGEKQRCPHENDEVCGWSDVGDRNMFKELGEWVNLSEQTEKSGNGPVYPTGLRHM